MLVKEALLFFIMAGAPSAFASIGMWNQHDLKDGVSAASWPSATRDSDIRRMVEETPAVVRIRRCTGAFVSKTGLLITGYDCALPTLVKYSTAQKDLVQDGFYAARSKDELKADLDFAVSVTLGSEDVTAKILEGIPKRVINKADYARIQDRKKLMEEQCSLDKTVHCSVQEVSGATRFILKKTVELKDFRMVFAPPFAAGNRQNRIMERQSDIPEAYFAVFRSYGGFKTKAGMPTEPLHYFPIRKQALEADERIYVPSYTWRYKRHLGAEVMYQAITGGLYDSLSTGFGDAIKEAVREESKRDARIENLYRSKIQGQDWQENGVDQLIATIGSSKALRELRIFEKNLRNHVGTHWSPEEQKILDERVAVYKKDAEAGTKSSPLARLTEIDSMVFLEWAEKEAGKANPESMEFKQKFAERKARFDLPTEARLMSLTMSMVKKEGTRLKLALPADVGAWLDKDEKLRLTELTSMFTHSKAFDWASYAEKSDFSQDSLAKLRASIKHMLEAYKENTDEEMAPYEYSYYRAMKEYSAAAQLPFYEGEKQDLLVWAFGKVKLLQTSTIPIHSSQVVAQNFLSSADVGIRRSIGAPTIDARGRFVGVYNSIDERDLFLDWYYNESKNTAIHTGIGTIRNVLENGGAKALIKELNL